MSVRITAFLNAYTQGISGGDACFLEIAKRQSDWDLTVVTSDLGRELCRDRGLDGQFVILSSERTFRRPVTTYARRTAAGLLRLRKELRADVYYATSDFLPDTLLARQLRRRHRGSAWVQKAFHLIPRSRTVSHYAQRASLQLIKGADRVIVDNESLREELGARGIPRERLGINYPGIDAAYFAGLRDDSAERYDAVFLGRLVRSKGVLDLVPIWKRVLGGHPAARLAIIGHGDAEVVQDLAAQIRREGLDGSIRMLGYLANDEAFAILRASKVFVFPSYEEGFGIAPLEAIASGLAVVAYDLPVFSEVFPAGMVRVRVGDIAQFADATCRLLASDAVREEMVRAASGLPVRYDWSRVAAREAEEVALAVEFARRQ